MKVPPLASPAARRSAVAPRSRTTRRAASRSRHRRRTKASASSEATSQSSVRASTQDSGGASATNGRGSSPQASRWSRTPGVPSRASKAARGSAASSPRVRIPHRSRLAARSGAGSSIATGSGARNASAWPGGTRVSPGAVRAARVAAVRVSAMPTRAGKPRSAIVPTSRSPMLDSGPWSARRPVRSRPIASGPGTSRRGETVQAASRSAPAAERSASRFRSRHTRAGARVTASLALMPGRTPHARAAAVASSTVRVAGVPVTTATGCPASRGSLRTSAAAAKCGTQAHA